MSEKLGINKRCYLINGYRHYGLNEVEYRGDAYRIVGEMQGNGFVLLLGPMLILNSADGEKQGETLARISDIKPYLRPLSSVTEEEWAELKEKTCPYGTGTFHEDGLHAPMNHFGHVIGYDLMSDIVEWFFEKRIDFMGMIDNGCAVAKTPENNE